MSDTGETFFTSIGCMDGRGLRPVRKFGKKIFKVWYMDAITEAGLVGYLAKAGIDSDLFKSIQAKALISLEKHHSKGIVVHGHEECAGNPVEEKQHKKDILDCAKMLETFAKGVPVIPVYIKKSNGEWTVEELSSSVLI